MATIRQEINILNSVLSSSTTISSVAANEQVQLDTTQYNGTVSYYYEIVAKNSDAVDRKVQDVGILPSPFTITIPANTTNFTLIRQAFTPSLGQLTSGLATNTTTTSNGSVQVKAARIVVIQTATSLTNTETQIEIGNAQAYTASTLTALTNPKYWLYTASKWNGTVTAFWETTMTAGSTKVTATAELQVDNGSFASWAAVGSDLTTTSATPTRVRSGAITLTDGRHYRVVYKTSTSKSAINAYNAKVIIDQGAITDSFTTAGSSASFGSSSANILQGQSFTTTSAYSISDVWFHISKNASPADNITVTLLSGSINGTVLATSNAVAGSALTSSMNWINFNFSTPVALSNNVQYFFQITRSGSADATNFYNLDDNTSNLYSGGDRWTNNGTSWSIATGEDLLFKVFGGTTITKLESQYLLANTLLAAGTGFQSFFSTLDPTTTEWDDGSGTTTFSAAADATGASSSVVTIQKSDGSVTYGTVTSPSNQGISAFSSTPGSAVTVDVKATTNNGDICAVRILAAFAWAAPITGTFNEDFQPISQPVNHFFPQIIST